MVATACRRLRFACQRLSIVGRRCRPASVDVGMPSPRNKTAVHRAGGQCAETGCGAVQRHLLPCKHTARRVSRNRAGCGAVKRCLTRRQAHSRRISYLRMNRRRCSPTTLTAMQAHCPTSQLQPSRPRYSQATLAAMQANCPMGQQSANGTGCGAVQRCLTAGKRSAACGRREPT